MTSTRLIARDATPVGVANSGTAGHCSTRRLRTFRGALSASRPPARRASRRRARSRLGPDCRLDALVTRRLGAPPCDVVATSPASRTGVNSPRALGSPATLTEIKPRTRSPVTNWCTTICGAFALSRRWAPESKSRTDSGGPDVTNRMACRLVTASLLPLGSRHFRFPVGIGKADLGL